MPTMRSVPLPELHLDLQNFRTMPQTAEPDAVRAIISARPEWFWALCESLLDDGYICAENVIVLNCAGTLVVKEGNRRIAAMKVISGLMPSTDLGIPTRLANRLRDIPAQWAQDNHAVPCVVYERKESSQVDAIVSLIHGKGEKAGRDQWNAVARARHARKANPSAEPGLDLLEKYLQSAENISPDQARKFGGEYPLTVLDEFITRFHARFGCASPGELAGSYPSISGRGSIESVMLSIGTGALGFEGLRKADASLELERDFGLPPKPQPAGPGEAPPNVGQPAPFPGGGPGQPASPPLGGPQPAPHPNPIPPPPSPPTPPTPRPPAAVPVADEREVKRKLRELRPAGQGRAKVATLIAEIKKLKLDIHPHAFCFVLRSLFELSAKAYCADHSAAGGPTCTKPDGSDKHLVRVLKEIADHMAAGNTQIERELHGAITYLADPNGVLSVTSLNQLVHNQNFSVDERHICLLFHNIFPLLKRMNS